MILIMQNDIILDIQLNFFIAEDDSDVDDLLGTGSSSEEEQTNNKTSTIGIKHSKVQGNSDIFKSGFLHTNIYFYLNKNNSGFYN